MLAFIQAHTPLRFAWVPGYSDYYPELPGGLARGRTVEPVPFDGRLLGEELAHLNPPYIEPPKGITITTADYRWLSLGIRHPRALLTSGRIAHRWLAARILGRRTLSMGQALAAGLRAGLEVVNVPVWLDTQMIDLHVENKRVVGVRVRRSGSETVIGARRGVLLASGGFEHNELLRRKYQRPPTNTQWSVGAEGNTGDGINAGERLGAALDLMDDAWWGPTIPLPGGPYFCLAERSLPGSFMVNGLGERFVNESAPYVDAVHAMYDNSKFPYWLIFDQRYRDRYLFAGLGPRQPLPHNWYEAKVAFRARKLEDLATRIEAHGLELTTETFNSFARTGWDEDFHRGKSAYDRYYGDPRNRPNPCLAPLTKPPFYAVSIVPGDLGTKGGLRTDERARVLREDSMPIPGLYAAGNASAAVMGHSYAGAGATLGPAMTFGYLAALDTITVED
jgi:3-oxosteroid 1-dehydrogenase